MHFPQELKFPTKPQDQTMPLGVSIREVAYFSGDYCEVIHSSYVEIEFQLTS